MWPYLLSVCHSSEDLWRLESFRRVAHVYIPEVLTTDPSPLDWRVWQDHLAPLSDRRLAEYVVQGIHDGFRIGFDY